MKNTPSIQKMLITLGAVFQDIFLECTTSVADTITMKDGTKLENTLTITINNCDSTIYVSVSDYQIDLFIWDNIIYKVRANVKYSYCDFTTYESLIAQIILSVYSIYYAQQYE